MDDRSDEARLQEFLEIVDVTGGEVGDWPPPPGDPRGKAKPAKKKPAKKAALPAVLLDPAEPSKFGLVLMPFGKHKGTAVAKVPRYYLQWLASSPNNDVTPSSVRLFKAKLLDYLADKPGDDFLAGR